MSDKWNLKDPFVYQSLMGLKNTTIAVQTARGPVRGRLSNVMPDHIVVMMGGKPFHVRTDQIIWYYPEHVRSDEESPET